MKQADLKTVVKLTKELVSKAKPTGKRQIWRDSECRGLLLRIYPSGKKTYVFDYRDPSGARQTFKVGDATRIDPGDARKRVRKLGEDPAAELRQKKQAAAQAKREAEIASGRTIRALLDEDQEKNYWHMYLKGKRSGRTTRRRLLSVFEPFIDQDIGTLDPADFITHRAKREAAGVSRTTLNRDRSDINKLLNWCVQWERISRNPLREKFEALETGDDERVRYLDQHEPGEYDRLMAALADPATPEHFADLVRLALHTGMRRSELFRLEWANVNRRDRVITAHSTTTKTNTARYIPINNTAMAVLERRARVRHISGLVFPDPVTGKEMTKSAKLWDALCERAQLKNFRLHDCRHHFASKLVQSGVGLLEIKELLGHSSIAMTEKYAHIDQSKNLALVRRLDSAA